MVVLAGNCHYLGNLRSMCFLCKIRFKKKPKMVVLCETFLDRGRMDEIRRKPSVASCLKVERRGQGDLFLPATSASNLGLMDVTVAPCDVEALV